MTQWVLKGLATGIRTTAYPDAPERADGASPGRPADTGGLSDADAEALAAVCPAAALRHADDGVSVDQGRCVHCFRCRRGDGPVRIDWEAGYEWACENNALADAPRRLGRAFGRSLHIRYVDAGACGACMSEARLLNNPYYNMHRLGFFVTPTPRNADILLVAGPLTEAMRLPLERTYAAMPEPKRVVAIGACALNGGVFGPSFASAGGVAGLVPVDVLVPGCPPPPLAILHGLLVAVERKPPVPLRAPTPVEVAK